MNDLHIQCPKCGYEIPVSEALSTQILAEPDIQAALERLAELSGEDVREAVLDRLFAKFCIGK